MKQTLKIKSFNNKEIEVVLPVPGMFGTMYVGSDRYAVICTEVISNKKCNIIICHNLTENNIEDVTKKDEEGIEYMDPTYFEYIKEKFKNVDPEYDERLEYSLRKNGLWYQKGSEMRPGCCGVRFGYAQPYCDPSF